ncbi:hypothetical protein ASPACDRAFT_125874 [Aspergillus aculeatus ATCC 16872]|uniref:Peptidase S8/S53 domain-containing protein n=1 Tax=Aspergillus aculeatus (strain ATCC 16872 / CBS 172.66 / WB 5094) TaxID=690307 RepID=A0A1L9WJI7_ASPA1|nr:uncharacterized protein ASPACDRAFT_125874 [Aspergillus aculeatus ATCC 16872]OJJ96323.1 hypothetical protein ASPACDRAFT_125874 [Aspergillus aculeatus ATCC 16872]
MSRIPVRCLSGAREELEESLPKATIHPLSNCDDSNVRNATHLSQNRLQSSHPARSLETDGVFSSGQDTRESEDWFNELDDLIRTMQCPSTLRGRYQPVRIAIIDTGLHPTYRSRLNVVEYKDLIDNRLTMRDNTWHGTLSATLAAGACDNAELYIARIFDTKDADIEQGPRLMAKVIAWAIEPKRRVDIISISAGFARHSPELQRAVNKASNAGTLIFAAASNWGNRGRVAFPARHSFKTMCIFSTNSRDQASSFNPEPRERADNFAILGEALTHPADSTKCESGTSMTTAIAARLTTRIIDVSRHEDNATIERVADVSSLAGMTAIFRSMSKRAGPFQCVSPLQLMPERHMDNTRERNRAYVRESLHRAMERAG